MSTLIVLAALMGQCSGGVSPRPVVTQAVADFGLAAFVRETVRGLPTTQAEALAANYRAEARRGAASVAELVRNTAAANGRTLGSDRSAWVPFGIALRDRINMLNQAGRLVTLADHCHAFEEVAEGLEGLSDPAAGNFGLNRSKIPGPEALEQYRAGNPAGHRFLARVTADDPVGREPEDATKPRLTVIGTADERAGVLADLAGNGPLGQVRGQVVTQDYDPASEQGKWAVADAGFDTAGHPTIYLQTPAGKVLWRQASYTGAAALATAIRKADPHYQPDRDPGPHTPAPAPAPAPTPVPAPPAPPEPPPVPVLPDIHLAPVLTGLCGLGILLVYFLCGKVPTPAPLPVPTPAPAPALPPHLAPQPVVNVPAENFVKVIEDAIAVANALLQLDREKQAARQAAVDKLDRLHAAVNPAVAVTITPG